MSSLLNNLAGYWEFNENTGLTTADTSGNGFTGTLTNGATWAVGQCGSGVQLANNTNFVNFGNLNTFDLIDNIDFTINIWAFITASNTPYVHLVNKGNDYISNPGGPEPYSGWAFYARSDIAGALAFGRPGVNELFSNAALTPGFMWHMCTVRRIKGSFDFFIDGNKGTAFGGGGATVGPANSQPLRMGNGMAGLQYPMIGTIDMAAIWIDRGLIDDEVKLLYNLQSVCVPIFPPSYGGGILRKSPYNIPQNYKGD